MGVLDRFVSTIDGLIGRGRLEGATAAQVAELEGVAGAEVPTVFAEYLTRVAGGEFHSPLFADLIYGPGRWCEPFSVDPYDVPVELIPIGAITEGQHRLSRTGPSHRGWHSEGLSLFYLSAATGPGTELLLVGDGPDPMVVGVDGVGFDVVRSSSLLALRFSRWLDGIVLPDQLAFGRDNMKEPTRFRMERPYTGDTAEVLEACDEILDSMLSTPLPPRASSDGPIPGMRSLVVGPDHPWLGPDAGAVFEIGPRALRSRRGALIDACLGAALILVGGGTVDDSVGVFGCGPGATLDPSEAAAALRVLRVSGDFDDLFLTYRETVAIPMAIHHGYSPT